MKSNWKIKVIIFSYIFLGFLISYNTAFAQAQGSTPFSGSDVNSYQCYDGNGNVIKDNNGNIVHPTTQSLDIDGNYYCLVGGQSYKAYLIPPKFQIIELWFVRILYIIWAAVGSLSFLLLIVLGFQYALTRGDPTQITAIRKRITYYIIGVVLVFLAYPIISTTFRVIGINTSVKCYDVQVPGFQFFFNNLCTDPRFVLVSNPCSSQSAEGYACPSNLRGTYYPTACSFTITILNVNLNYCYYCDANQQVWKKGLQVSTTQKTCK